MVGIAVAALAVSLIGTVVAQQLIGSYHAGVAQSLELTAGVLDTVDESFVVAEDSLIIIGEGVGEAERAVRSLGGSMAEGQEALDAVAALSGGDIADAIEDIERALPAVQQAAETIDDSLAELDERLDEVSGLIGSYIERTEDATELVDHQRQVLDTSARRARLAIVAFGLVFGLSQFVPLYLGLTLMRGAVEIRDP